MLSVERGGPQKPDLQFMRGTTITEQRLDARRSPYMTHTHTGCANIILSAT